jgi:hypothetical protein
MILPHLRLDLGVFSTHLCFYLFVDATLSSTPLASSGKMLRRDGGANLKRLLSFVNELY